MRKKIKSKMTTKFKQLLMAGLVLALFPGTAWAMAADPVLAPLNPAFVEYQKNLESATAASDEDFPKGDIPTPLKAYDGPIDTSKVGQRDLPAQFDLRTTGIVPPIRNQSPYGSCWSFAMYASLESHLAKTEGQFTDLSENNLMWNHGFDADPDGGGNRHFAIAYLSRWAGPVLESHDPYGSPQKTGLPPAYHVQEVEFIPNVPELIKETVMDKGMVATRMRADNGEENEFYNADTAAFYYNGQDNPNHAIAIVGWDDHFSKENFNITPPGDGAWIIRNSWGTEFHQEGYFYLSYHDTHAGRDVTAFHQADQTDNYANIYQYDPLGPIRAIGYPYDGKGWGANIFEAEKDENLKAISTHIVYPDTTLTIEVYTDVEADRPDSGNLRLVQSQVFEHDGYYTIDLDDLVPLVAGEKFAVAIEYSTPKTDQAIPVEVPVENYSSQASANPQESFIRNTKKNDWIDISQAGEDNVCIKAFTGGTSLTPRTTYRTHVQNDGWQEWKNNGAMSGTSGRALRLEGIELKTDTPDYHLGLAYKTHIENIGWEDHYKYDGQMSGTSNQGLRLEAIQIELTGRDAETFNVYYRVHAENLGWLDWAKNNEPAGSAGLAYRLEGIEIKILEKGAPAPGATSRAFVSSEAN